MGRRRAAASGFETDALVNARCIFVMCEIKELCHKDQRKGELKGYHGRLQGEERREKGNCKYGIGRGRKSLTVMTEQRRKIPQDSRMGWPELLDARADVV